jgi:hypothetical protein
MPIGGLVATPDLSHFAGTLSALGATPLLTNAAESNMAGCQETTPYSLSCCAAVGFRRAFVKAASSARSSSQLISGDIRDEHAHPANAHPGNPRQSFAVGAGGHDSRSVMWTSRPESYKSASPAPARRLAILGGNRLTHLRARRRRSTPSGWLGGRNAWRQYAAYRTVEPEFHTFNPHGTAVVLQT